jgi:hypothetical protein
LEAIHDWEFCARAGGDPISVAMIAKTAKWNNQNLRMVVVPSGWYKKAALVEGPLRLRVNRKGKKGQFRIKRTNLKAGIGALREMIPQSPRSRMRSNAQHVRGPESGQSSPQRRAAKSFAMVKRVDSGTDPYPSAQGALALLMLEGDAFRVVLF